MRTVLPMLAAIAVTGVAGADLVNPDVPGWRGDAGTSYAEFDTFTQAFAAPNFADVGGGGWSLTNNGAPGTATIASSTGNGYWNEPSTNPGVSMKVIMPKSFSREVHTCRGRSAA